RFCCRMLNDADEAKDVVQEVFLRFFESPVRFDGEISVKVWLFRSARNRCLNLIRDRSKISNMGHDGEEPVETKPDGPDPHEAHYIVRNLFERMPSDYKEILILREWDQLSYDEIAQTLGTTVSAVKSKLFKARKQAASIYRKLYGD
ncbi:MAG TPA: RNA polymerase sigma factor, partial [Candidatus Kryptobacter bacterium]|nr:RNA polymerase sigma factor [Candidatus Kryptobacter bacterium]